LNVLKITTSPKANAICETPASITNIANVCGGGDSNLRNNASSNVVVAAS